MLIDLLQTYGKDLEALAPNEAATIASQVSSVDAALASQVSSVDAALATLGV